MIHDYIKTAAVITVGGLLLTASAPVQLGVAGLFLGKLMLESKVQQWNEDAEREAKEEEITNAHQEAIFEYHHRMNAENIRNLRMTGVTA